MRRTTIGLIAAFALLAQAGPARALTVDEIVAKVVEAHGGAAKLKAIRSLRLTGKVYFGSGDGGVEGEWATLHKRSTAALAANQVRSEFTLQGLTAVDAYDGKEAWSLEPFEGRRDGRRASADEARGMARHADLDGPLVDWRAKGHRVESLGTEDVDGTAALKLRVSLKDGDTQYIYLDPDCFLEIRVVTESRVRGVERIQETDLGSYYQVAGVWLPMSIESGTKGRPRSARFTYERAEVNVAAEDALFHFPAAGTSITRSLIADPKAAPLVATAAPKGKAAGAPSLDAGVLSGLRARNIGSATMSGRIAAIAARTDGGKTTLYVGAASGGVWKSLDGGTTFKPVFDKSPVQSIGALALDPSNPRTVWVGTGEAWTRNSVSVGDGIYKSTDAGESWQRMGLPESERIARIVVHPKNGDTVYACVPGKLWSDSSDRGLYKTSDGGKTWSQILKGTNGSTGCSTVVMDPANPDVLFAGLWDFRRKGWTFRSGGDGPEAQSGSGLFRSADGGKSWSEVKAGLPEKPWGRVEVTIAPSDPRIVYALIEARQSALYRSSDGGVTWEARDRSQGMIWRPFYFARLIVDPKNPDRVFKPGGSLIASEDGGRSFSNTGGRAHGDWHDVWIDPENTQHVIGGDDGGLWISRDGGSRWWKTDSLPVSQFYHVSLDAKDPYQVYGGLQDNASWIGDSAHPGGITNSRWEAMPFGDGFWTLVDPTDPNAVYNESQGGYLNRWDRTTGAYRDIQPKAQYKEKLRFNWNAPIHLSPTNKGTLYIGAQFLFRTRDRGDTWERISPDLSTNDPQKQKQELSGGITVDNSSAEMHTTIYSISESPLDGNLLWVGTDDGNVQLSRDAGKSWSNVVGNVKGLPAGSWVSWVEASRFHPGSAYAAFDRHTAGDLNPWVYKTTDYGKSWTRIATPADGVRGYAHCVKEDAVKASLLFVGTELGLFISVDGGAHWAEFKGGDFPSVAVREIAIQPRDGDLVLATHGRGIWIVDDLTPLRALTPEVLGKSAAFLPGRPVQQRMPSQGGWVEGDASFIGENPPGGAVNSYYQRAPHLYGPLKLEVLDANGKLVDTVPVTRRRGLNRVAWSMQMKPPRVPRAAQVAYNAAQGPRVLPGKYTLRLTKGSEVVETGLEIGLDRRAPYGTAERKEQFEATLRAHALFEEMSALVDRIDGARAALGARIRSLPEGDALGKKLVEAAAHIDEAKKKIVATKEGGAITGEERLREHLDILYGALMAWEGRPARYQVERIDVLARELREVAGEFDAVVAKDVRPLDEALRTRKLEPIPAGAKTQADPAPSEMEMAIHCLRADDRCVVESRSTAQTRE